MNLFTLFCNVLYYSKFQMASKQKPARSALAKPSARPTEPERDASSPSSVTSPLTQTSSPPVEAVASNSSTDGTSGVFSQVVLLL